MSEAPAHQCVIERASHAPLAGLVLLAVSAGLIADIYADNSADLYANKGADEIFIDQTQASGLEFVHFNGMSGELYFPEMMGPGVGLFDYDNDGDLDVYLVQGHMLGPDKKLKDAVYPPTSGQPLSDRLYRNDLGRDGAGSLRFTDVTGSAGIKAGGYGMGVAAADYDNDGDVDLYVTNFGSNQLWRNEGDGTFSDVTAQAGVDDERWSVSASFVDYDRDGLLDLYVGNYVVYALEDARRCRNPTSVADYCGPNSFKPESDSLFRNLGDGRFENVSYRSGLGKARGAGLGISTADFNGDGQVDMFVANDGMANFLWIGDGDGGFVDDGLFAGVAVNGSGMSEASMGVDAADFDGDGDEDLFMTHLVRETNTLYVNDGAGLFEDRTSETGLANPSVPFTGFGAGFFDYDNDGWLDLFIVNGGVTLFESEAWAQEGDDWPLHRPNQLFHNDQGRFRDISESSGKALKASEVSRGTAFGDLDNDGDTDLIVANNSGPAQLLTNAVGSQGGWIGLRLMTAGCRRDALGARAQLVLEGGRSLWRRARSDGSYGSANDPRILIGLGKVQGAHDVLVVWPDGSRQRWSGLKSGSYHRLCQNDGKGSKGAGKNGKPEGHEE